MNHYVLKLYNRRRAGETVGWLKDRIVEFDAPDNDAARHEAYGNLDNVNWDTQFAALESDDGKFVSFWTNKDA
jgi:hypothetical protein